MPMSEIKNCKNCEYFVQHYIKEDTTFKCVDFGHCSRDGKSRGISRKPDTSACARWKQADTNGEQQDEVCFNSDYVYSMLKKFVDILSAYD